MAEPKRTFNGKSYISRLAYHSKSQAQKVAREQRQKGRSARVVYQKKIKVWQVWVH